MLKSNSKAVREKVKKWIIDNFDISNYDIEVDTNDFKAVCKTILETCEEEKFYRCYPTREKMMEDWFQGLPSILNTASYIYCGSAIDLVAEWLEETEKEKARFTESDAEHMASYLIIREILKGAK